ncbi:ion transporter [Salibacteraceae bacterium]|jgi:voltage-gated potassium channel|nr:ion transporter [Salibacteraceae bacterium]
MKKKLYDLLENDELNNGKKFLFDIFLAIIILTSIVFIFLENEKGELTPVLDITDKGITFFFIVEFLLRFYVSSNFRKDVKEQNLRYAVMQKIKWFFQLTTLIDFLSIIPSIKFFRVFRTLRFLRLFRILKAYRSIKTFRELDKIFTILKGMKEESRIFYVFFSFTVFFMIIISFALYISESGEPDSEFNNFKDSIWYSIQVIGFGDNTPKTIAGKVFAGLLLLINMAVFGFFVSIILNKIQNIMDAVTSGKIGKIKLENHIVICGYTKSSQNVIEDLLKDKSNINNIVLISQKKIEDDLNGVIYVNADFTELKSLTDVNIDKAKFAIVFAESKEHDSSRDIDLRTVITIYHIETINPEVHTIAEINDEENAEIIKDKIQGDEILYKEKIDSRIILNCIKHKNISPMIYELFGESNKERLAESNLEQLKLNPPVSIKEVKSFFNNQDATFLGFINDKNESFLSPKNDINVENSHRLIYIKN